MAAESYFVSCSTSQQQQVSRMFMSALQAMSHMSVGRAASFADLKGTYNTTQKYLKAFTMPAPSQTQVCHASHHGAQILGNCIAALGGLAVTTDACFLLYMLAETYSAKCNEVCCVCQAQTSDKSLSSGFAMYLQSSVMEGLPVSILEAGLSGVCVVCTDMIAYGQLEVMAILPSLEILKLQQPPELDRDHLQAYPQVQQRRQEWGLGYSEFILSRFSISVHAMQQRQALYLGHFSQQRRDARNKQLMRRNTTSVLYRDTNLSGRSHRHFFM
ncbi:hypothetical protein WJX77_008457 [Trebouxia sp. C0004]